MGFIIFSVIFLSIVAWNSCWFISFATHHSSYEGFLLFIVEFIALPIIAVLGCFFGWNFAKKCHKKRHKLAAVLSGFALFTCLVAVPMMFVIPGGLTFEQGVLAFFGRVLVCTPELLPAYLFATLYYYKNRKKKDETKKKDEVTEATSDLGLEEKDEEAPKTIPKLSFATVLAYLAPVVWLVAAFLVGFMSEFALRITGIMLFYFTVVMAVYTIIVVYCLFRRVINYYYMSSAKWYVVKTLLWLALLVTVFGVLIFFLPTQSVAGGGIMHVIHDCPWACLAAVALPALAAMVVYCSDVRDDEKIKAIAEEERAKPKKHQLAKGIASVAVVAASAAVVTFVIVWKFVPVRLISRIGASFEVNTDHLQTELVSEIKGGEIIYSNVRLNTTAVGEYTARITVRSLAGDIRDIEVPYKVVDTTPPVIESKDEVTMRIKDDYIIEKDFVKATDNSEKKVNVWTEGKLDRQVEGSYELTVLAEDESGNVAKKKMTIHVISEPSMYGYYIRVNRTKNVVIVYWLTRDGEIGGVARTMIASVGKEGSETPVGTFRVSDRYETLFLVGDVWGRYATRIDGRIFFHSVPYFSKGDPHWDDLEYLEYNKLGSPASAGCVRLRLVDAEWIYKYVKAGTVVEIYDDEELPEGVDEPKAAPHILTDDTAKRGWDPTDPDDENPWHHDW